MVVATRSAGPEWPVHVLQYVQTTVNNKSEGSVGGFGQFCECEWNPMPCQRWQAIFIQPL